jgi:hypothetical protein
MRFTDLRCSFLIVGAHCWLMRNLCSTTGRWRNEFYSGDYPHHLYCSPNRKRGNLTTAELHVNHHIGGLRSGATFLLHPCSVAFHPNPLDFSCNNTSFFFHHSFLFCAKCADLVVSPLVSVLLSIHLLCRPFDVPFFLLWSASAKGRKVSDRYTMWWICVYLMILFCSFAAENDICYKHSHSMLARKEKRQETKSKKRLR